MNIGYIISAYKYGAQVERLIRRLDGEGASFFLHIDKRAGGLREELSHRLRDVTDLHFLEQHRCVWGGFGHVAATLKGIDAICERRVPCEYVVLLTGQDYPIRPLQHIHEVLKHAEGRSFMEYFPLPTTMWDGGGFDRVLRWHLRVLGRHFVFPRRHTSRFARRFPAGFRPFGGSSYWCLARDVVDYVHAFFAANPSFVRFFRHVDVPDEVIFQTILLNSDLRDRIVNDDLRYIRWPDPASGSPAILTTSDFSDLARSPKLFGRKFDATVDENILDLIDARILGGKAP